ncbi:VIT1/CCC1 transporter family protein [Acinetobacter pollinis]|uniref:VIT1/CCC1 transporter family protein n=1 Tax=Acinetobacter pollinis TaxID=2605270 RepID=UPI0018A2E489|nr:VIT family protein [Acinetobacter pollinis]MBF7691140.1 VIT family protein [Acinetobacter pollinis]MBF7693922.1 VIT family protein [Acinetobacter pollinis]MBF7698786.1 VIT family protein [Acinetobacter pollinis]MBF7701571.1 VIT family protein [Acinetobacter pollinis]
MSLHSHHEENHYTERSGWLRAAVLGANDGIISVTSLVVGISASGATVHTLLITCIAGVISGAVSMAAGEFISVKSQQDIEDADLRMEAKSLDLSPDLELLELTKIYIHRGLDKELAFEVAQQLTAHNALAAHARDEIGINEETAAQPFLAAFSSAISFALGGTCPLLAILLLPRNYLEYGIIIVGVVSLGVLGIVSSYAGGSNMIKGAIRVMLWGIVAMAFTFWIGSLFNVSV